MTYIVKRLLAGVISLLILSLFIFSLIRMVPGDPAAVLMGDITDSEQLEQVRSEMGLDKSLPVQYMLWLKRVTAGDLGKSFMTKQKVTEAIWSHFIVTLQVVVIAFIIAAAIAIPAGVYAARYQNSWLDSLVTASATLFLSLPSFWVGILLILLLSAEAGWMPAMGFVAFSENPYEWFRHITLPIITLVLVEVAILTRIMRASTLDVLSQDYIAYVRAKGMPENVILKRHVVRNAVSPTVSVMGIVLGSLLSGTAIVETIFSLPGLGRLLVNAIYARDYPVIQGTLLFIVVIYMLVNILVDLIYPLLDPRVKLR